jgi:hypothetical protein
MPRNWGLRTTGSSTLEQRCQWDELLEVWQKAFMRYMNVDPDDPFDPAAYRGLWRVGEQLS